MTRLTTTIREEIRDELLRHRFAKDFIAIEDAVRDLALAVYEEVYDAETRAAMEALPEGWLARSETIDVRFGGNWVRLSFAGSFRRYEWMFRLPDPRPAVSKLVLAQHQKGDITVLAHDHPLTVRFEDVDRAADKLRVAVHTAERKITAALCAVSSVEKLIATWPEVEPFAKGYIESKGKDGKPKLPAIPVEALNAALDLPVGEYRWRTTTRQPAQIGSVSTISEPSSPTPQRLTLR